MSIYNRQGLFSRSGPDLDQLKNQAKGSSESRSAMATPQLSKIQQFHPDPPVDEVKAADAIACPGSLTVRRAGRGWCRRVTSSTRFA
jgi:hypothetical protein